jgi:protein-L-isoaspartate(D-aspartate) O-methyltransferase
MVEAQVARRGLREPRLLAALRKVERHRFVPESCRNHAYEDGPLPIGQGQTISQPYIVALMTNLLQLQGHERVLEVGTGSGYQAAILAELAGEVYTIERHTALSRRAGDLLHEYGYTNVIGLTGDGTLGWPPAAPFQGILVTAAAPRPPQTLLDQLAEGGRLVIPVGGRFSQELEVWERHGNRFEQETILPVVFVPLLGEQGWQESDWENH